MTASETVGDAMLKHPIVHRVDLNVGEVRAIFAERAKNHLLLLADGGLLVSTVTRDDVADSALEPMTLAVAVGSVEGRTVRPDVPAETLRAAMANSGLRRIAVVDAEMHLLGLLCLKKSLQGFCTDEGVARMRLTRRIQSRRRR